MAKTRQTKRRRQSSPVRPSAEPTIEEINFDAWLSTILSQPQPEYSIPEEREFVTVRKEHPVELRRRIKRYNKSLAVLEWAKTVVFENAALMEDYRADADDASIEY